MIQAIINNFQSIEEAKLNIEGLTLIIGESSQGKSACLRALQAACTNRFKAGQVRHGEDHALIRIKTPESNEVLSVLRPWNGGSPKMKLGVQVFSKLGRTLPQQVSEFLNLGTLDVSGESYSCNFHSQFQPPLLLAYSQPKVMELLSASSALDDLKETKEALMEKRSSNKGAISAVESIIKSTSKEVDQVNSAITALEPLVEELKGLSSTLTSLEERLSLVDELLLHLSTIKNLDDKENILNQIDCISTNLSALNEHYSLVNQLNEEISKLNKLTSRYDILSEISSSCDESVSDRLASVDYLLNLLHSLETNSLELEKKQKVVSVLEELVTVQSYLNDKLRVKYSSYSELHSLSLQLNLLKSNEDNLKTIVEDHICPVCGSVVSYNE